MSELPFSYNVRELARELRVSASTARRLAKQIGFRAGRDLRVHREQLLEWLRSGRGLPPRDPTPAERRQRRATPETPLPPPPPEAT